MEIIRWLCFWLDVGHSVSPSRWLCFWQQIQQKFYVWMGPLGHPLWWLLNLLMVTHVSCHALRCICWILVSHSFLLPAAVTNSIELTIMCIPNSSESNHKLFNSNSSWFSTSRNELVNYVLDHPKENDISHSNKLWINSMFGLTDPNGSHQVNFWLHSESSPCTS